MTEWRIKRISAARANQPTRPLRPSLTCGLSIIESLTVEYLFTHSFNQQTHQSNQYVYTYIVASNEHDKRDAPENEANSGHSSSSDNDG
eukprot:GHVU01190251.1.p1 GENE.GHVU01190251.1~~GHVU01190251.1.p1  ORF type:complete len:101 (+),score=3.61 GHVU01190251.1:39-305(+)